MLLAGDAVADVVLVQAPGEAPVVRVHLTGPGVRTEVDLSGVQAWTLAGVLIDATVTHRQAVAGPPTVATPDAEPATVDRGGVEPGIEASGGSVGHAPIGRAELAGPVRWWMARHRAVGARRVRFAFRCVRPVPPRQAGPDDAQPDPDGWW